jgi:hypothetical protein
MQSQGFTVGAGLGSYGFSAGNYNPQMGRRHDGSTCGSDALAIAHHDALDYPFRWIGPDGRMAVIVVPPVDLYDRHATDVGTYGKNEEQGYPIK